MRAFRFSLQRVTRVREIKRDVAKAEWAQAIMAQNQAEEQLEQFRQAASAKAIGLHSGASFSQPGFRSIAHKSELRIQAVQDATAKVDLARARVVQLQHELQVAQQKVDGMERLKDAQFTQWQADIKTQEAKENDDITVTRQGSKIAKERKEKSKRKP